MRKLILLFTISLMISCITEEEKKEIIPKIRFKVGDIAYLKPDSLKCTIYYFGENHWNPHYAIRYIDKNRIMRESGNGWQDKLISENSFY